MNIDESGFDVRDYAQLGIFELFTSLKISVVSKSKEKIHLNFMPLDTSCLRIIGILT